MLDLEAVRATQLQKLNKIIIPAVNYYPEKAKEFRIKLGKLSDLNNAKHKTEKAITNAKNNQKLDKVQTLSDKHSRIVQDSAKDSNTFEKEMVEYEASRTEDNKYVILHYIHSELAYHASALEQLTKLYQEINLLEPKEELQRFVQTYNLNSMRDADLEGKYNYKVGETDRKKEALKNPQTKKNDGMITNKSKPNINIANPKADPIPKDKVSLNQMLDDENNF